MRKILLSLTILLLFIGTARAQISREELTSSASRSAQNSTGAGVPRGAVMAFDLGGRCPNGWSKWTQGAGRVIVGSGSLDGENYKTSDTGGEAKSMITADNIQKSKVTVNGLTIKVKENTTPPYVMVADTSVNIQECIDRDKHCTRYPPRPFTTELGNDNAKAFDNRQPYIALTYCRKN